MSTQNIKCHDKIRNFYKNPKYLFFFFVFFLFFFVFFFVCLFVYFGFLFVFVFVSVCFVFLTIRRIFRDSKTSSNQPW